MEESENIQKLLDEVGKIHNKYVKLAEQTGCDFNVFTGRCLDERFMCDVLVKIINPEEHHLGKLFSKKFVKEVLKIKNFEISKVEREVCIIKNIENKIKRPIDIVLYGTNDEIIPVEVKIKAGDQKSQLYDYFQQCGKPRKIYYLTKFGTEPSLDSITSKDNKDIKLNEENIELLSWETSILNYLNSCISDIETIERTRILQTLIQYKEAIQNFTDKGDIEMEEIKNLLLNNREIAEQIYENLDKIKEDDAKSIEENLRDATKEFCNSFPDIFEYADYNKFIFKNSKDKNTCWFKFCGNNYQQIQFNISKTQVEDIKNLEDKGFVFTKDQKYDWRYKNICRFNVNEFLEGNNFETIKETFLKTLEENYQVLNDYLSNSN